MYYKQKYPSSKSFVHIWLMKHQFDFQAIRALALGIFNWGIYLGYGLSYAVGNFVTEADFGGLVSLQLQHYIFQFLFCKKWGQSENSLNVFKCDTVRKRNIQDHVQYHSWCLQHVFCVLLKQSCRTNLIGIYFHSAILYNNTTFVPVYVWLDSCFGCRVGVGHT